MSLKPYHFFFSLLFLVSCGKPPAPQTPYTPKLAEPDWAKLTEESTGILQSLIKISSISPPPQGSQGELEVAQKMAELLKAEGIEPMLVESAPGRGNIMARLKGDGSKKPIILLCHIDVVSVEKANWKVDPFEGVIKDGYIFGRGAIDDKGMCTANLMAFVSLKRQSIPLKRDVIFLATADEETDGTGIDFMVKNYSKELEAEYVLNEGGVILQDAVTKGQTLIAISAAEKGVAWLHLTAKGKPGHGSVPRPEQSTDRLRDALTAVSEMERKKVFHVYAKELVLRLGEETDGATGFMMRHPKLAPGLILNGLASSPTNLAVVTNTVNLTKIQAGNNINVIPGIAEAWLDCRLLPGTTPETMRLMIEDLTKPFGVEVELVQAINATTSSWDTELFRALERHMSEGVKNSVTAPILSPGYTDSRPFRERGVTAYGIVPFNVNDDELASMHGNNERLKVTELGLGVKRVYRVLVEVGS